MALNEDIIGKLNLEISDAKAAKSAYDSFIKPFIDAKTLQMFEAFQAVGLSDTDGLMEVKRMLASLKALDDEIKSVITTGNLASRQLNENEDEK